MSTITILAHSANPPTKKILEILHGLGLQTNIVKTVYGDKFPPVNTVDGLIILGSPAGIYQSTELNWISKEIAWVAKVLKQEVPIFGICFGCQMLAQLHGGDVHKGKAEQGFEFGYVPVTPVHHDDTFGDELNGSKVFQAHGDTFTMPKGAIHLLTGSVYNNQAVKFANNVYGTQFHPEVTPKIASTWHQSMLDSNMDFIHKFPAPSEYKNTVELHQPAVHKWLAGFLERLFC